MIVKVFVIMAAALVFGPHTTLSESLMLTFCDPVHRRDARDEIAGFFNQSDALNITWLHAANSPEKLQEGLTGNYMMLEADVLMRSDGEPIMAHIPATDSNLTLKEFLAQTLFSSRGIKLDFKTIEVIEPFLKILLNMTTGMNIKIPILVNADILDGPCYTPSKCNPVNARQFLDLTKRYAPNSILSIGWRTQFNAAYHYNWSFVIPMGQLLVDVSQPVTFPIRYSLVGRSLEQLEWLMDLSETFTLTFGSSTSDEVKPKDLAFLRLDMIPDRRRIYYDIPVDQMTDFMKELETYKRQTTDGPVHDIKVNWRGFTTTACTSILIGQSSIMFTEQGGWASTDKENKPVRNRKTLYKKYIILSASVVFIDDNKSSINQNVTFVLHSAGLKENQENHNTLLGTTAVLQNDGNFELVTPDGAMKHGGVASSSTYQVKVTDIGDGEMWFEVKPGGTDEQSWQKLSGHDEVSKSFYTLIGTLQQPGAVLVKNLQMSTVEGNTCTKDQDCSAKPYQQCLVVSGNPQCLCQLTCPKHLASVCGSDGKSYGNLCVLKAHACESGKLITVTRNGNCESSWWIAVYCSVFATLSVVLILVFLYFRYYRRKNNDFHCKKL